MLTFILLLVLLVSCWLVFKSIDYFEKIWNYVSPIYCSHCGIHIHDICAAETRKIL